MYYKKKSNVIFRNYDSFGYITDNRNFGYRQAIEEEKDIGDKIVSQSGAVFLSVLGCKPMSLDDLVKRISKVFANTDIEMIKTDAKEFYSLLEEDGFVVSGNTVQECNDKDIGFSYKTAQSKSEREKGECTTKIKFKKDTQEFFEQYFQGEPQLTNLHIEITGKCNERCVHCYIPHENKVSSMDIDLFYNILEQCRKMNLLHLTISGGEPMLHSNFVDILRKCNEYNFSINILTNLTLLDDTILAEMKKNPLLGVQTSLYSMDSEVHNTITQVQGSFEKTKNAIVRLIENNIPLQISCPIMKQNVDSYNEVVNWGKEHNINVGSDYVIIARYDHTVQNLFNRLSLDDVKGVIMKRATNNEDYLDQLKQEAKEKQNRNPDDFICSVCHSSICIAENGEVYPCAGWQDYIVGDMKETTLYDIWHNSPKVQYLRNLRRTDFPRCIQCQESDFCTMCMVRNANEDPSGNPLNVNEYFCNIARINKELAQNGNI